MGTPVRVAVVPVRRGPVDRVLLQDRVVPGWPILFRVCRGITREAAGAAHEVAVPRWVPAEVEAEDRAGKQVMVPMPL